ncbi:hypothetical protein NVP1250O_75 [Vibrio phage 1.250.O._10N.261.55.E11]|nr:hypothetical protein NVP1250O_75 [Vibrio phage 1.250.O._10N.261.55.E11]
MKNRRVKQMIESITGGRYVTLYNLDTGDDVHVALVFRDRTECFNKKVSVTADKFNPKLGGTTCPIIN